MVTLLYMDFPKTILYVGEGALQTNKTKWEQMQKKVKLFSQVYMVDDDFWWSYAIFCQLKIWSRMLRDFIDLFELTVLL